jgi:hypothetical protein
MVLNSINESRETIDQGIRQRRDELAALGLRPTDGTMESLSPKPILGETLIEIEPSGPLVSPRLLSPLPRSHPLPPSPVLRNGLTED